MLKNASSPETSFDANFDVKSEEQRYLSGMRKMRPWRFLN